MFYLVGSRFYGNHKPDSDFDFIAEDTPENHQVCIRMGLVKLDSIHERYYGYGLDVCLVKDLADKLWVRDELAKLPNIATLSKDERHAKLKELLHGRKLG